MQKSTLRVDWAILCILGAGAAGLGLTSSQWPSYYALQGFTEPHKIIVYIRLAAVSCGVVGATISALLGLIAWRLRYPITDTNRIRRDSNSGA